MLDVIKNYIFSRKVHIFLATALVNFLVAKGYISDDPTTKQDLIAAVTTIGSVLIYSIAHEDAAKHTAGTPPAPPNG